QLRRHGGHADGVGRERGDLGRYGQSQRLVAQERGRRAGARAARRGDGALRGHDLRHDRGRRLRDQREPAAGDGRRERHGAVGHARLPDRPLERRDHHYPGRHHDRERPGDSERGAGRRDAGQGLWRATARRHAQGLRARVLHGHLAERLKARARRGEIRGALEFWRAAREGLPPPQGGGGVKVLVAIADVDAVVRVGAPLDEHARTNTTSVYTAAEVFPMLPERLSTDLSSLAEGEERLSLVVDMTVTAAGAVDASVVYRAVVVNRAKLAYDSVAAWLEGRGPPPARAA